MATNSLVVLLIAVSLCTLSMQSSFYSLQPAVEALSEREAQLALRNEIDSGNIDDFDLGSEFDWNNEFDEREQRVPPPRTLTRFSARSSSDYDDFYPSDYRKRAMYRKRGSSVFRERSRAPGLQHQQQQALAEKFLRAIDEEREREEEVEYQKELRNMWNRYQLEESDIEKELFDNNAESDYPLNNDDSSRKRSRQSVGNVEVAPSTWNDKRSPMLPWLPAARKKRFPVSKRSPKVTNELTAPDSSEKVSQDLKGIFGANEGDKNGADDAKKKKRSSDDESALGNSAKRDEMSQAMQGHENMHAHKTMKKRKRDANVEGDDDEEPDNENDNDDEGEDTDEGDDSSEDDSKKKRKKRSATKSLEVVQEDLPSKNKPMMAKKSFEWSKIFGLDRKKKSTDMNENRLRFGHGSTQKNPLGLIFHPLTVVDSRRKKCEGECPSDGEDYDEDDYEDEDYRRKRKRSREEKLDTMDRKLKAMENLIIEDTAKYYGNHEGSLSASQARALQSRVGDRLATAYSLEKMRKAIERLKQSMDFEKNLERNLLGGAQLESKGEDKKKKAKRVAVKKEKAEFENTDHDIDAPSKKASTEHHENDLSEDASKKKKKRSQKKSEVSNYISDEAPMSEGYMGGRVSSECPILDSIEKKCRGIDIMSGDSNQNLLEACGAHQLCYLCGDSDLQCDYEYMTEVEEACDRDLKCSISARQALYVLRNIGGTRIPQRECIRNPCLNMALQSIAY